MRIGISITRLHTSLSVFFNTGPTSPMASRFFTAGIYPVRSSAGYLQCYFAFPSIQSRRKICGTHNAYVLCESPVGVRVVRLQREETIQMSRKSKISSSQDLTADDLHREEKSQRQRNSPKKPLSKMSITLAYITAY